MTQRTNYSSGTKWESTVGYSRAVKVGKQIFVAGTTAVDENGNVVGEGNAYEQTKFIFWKIGKVLEKAGAHFKDVVRTRIFVTNIKDQPAIGKAHYEFFKDIKPAATMVEVNKLVDDRLLIEIEVDAVSD